MTKEEESLPLLFGYSKGWQEASLMAQWVKESACNTEDRDMGSVPGLGRSPGVGNGKSLQYSYLENSKDRGAWWTTYHVVADGWI